MSEKSIGKQVYQKLKLGDFPDALTLEEADELPNFRTFTEKDARGNALDAHEFARKVNGVAYTQVDWDAPYPNDRGYVKGFHLVNRTGVYAVTWR